MPRAHWLFFAVLGPPLGLLVLLALALVLGGGWPLEEVKGFLMIGLPLSYVLGLVPALVAARAIQLIETRNLSPKLLWVGGVGLTIGILLNLSIFLVMGRDLSEFRDLNTLIYILVCLIPTLVCRYLSRGWNNRSGQIS
jgi:hypothetical protein